MFNNKVLAFKKRAHLASTSFNRYAAWKAYAFVIFSAILYEILIFFEGLNSSFFIFQILLMLEAGTFFAHFVLLFIDRNKKCFVNLFVAVSIAISALSPFLLSYTRLHIGGWDMWAFLYFAVGYPLSYIALSVFAFSNRNIYYKNSVAAALGVIMILLSCLTLFYAILYGGYQYYINLDFIPRRTVALIVFNVQYQNISLVERLFQFALLLNSLCISNKKFSLDFGIVNRSL